MSYDFVNNDKDPSPDSPYNDHGTSCAGIIGAAKNGVCGVGIAYNVYLGGELINLLCCVFIVQYNYCVYLSPGIDLIGGATATDIMEANALSYERVLTDIYSNSWGPDDDGYTVGRPRTLLKRILKEGVAKVSNPTFYI